MQVKPSIYLIGSLRKPRVIEVASRLRSEGWDVFDDWYAAGPEADDYWQRYEMQRGHTFSQALEGEAARNVFNFDYRHLDKSSIVVLVLPAGKSGHLEFGWAIGRGKKGFILLDGEPERWDVMYQFATGVVNDVEELMLRLDNV